MDSSTVLVVLIGANWFQCRDQYGGRMIDWELDWVRKENAGKAAQLLGTDLLEKLLECASAPAQNLIHDLDRRMSGG